MIVNEMANVEVNIMVLLMVRLTLDVYPGGNVDTMNLYVY